MTLRMNHIERLFDLLGWFIIAILCVMSLSTLQSCAGAPKMPHEVTLYTGSPEVAGICALDTASNHVKTILPVDHYITKSNMKCVQANDPAFATYMSMSWDDAQMLFTYLETVINSCATWKTNQ